MEFCTPPDEENRKNTTIIIAVEGNIGSGKSTLVKNLENELKDNKDVCFLQEPVDEWDQIKDADGKTMIEKYYGDQKKYAFSFQMMAYISRLKRLRDGLKKHPKVIIVERSIFTDKNVFASMLYNDKKIEDVEYTIYLKWFDEFLKDIPPISTIYVKTTPEVAKQRVDSRARKGETIPFEYLKLCHEYHEKWLNNEKYMEENDVLIIDGNIDINNNPAALRQWIADIQTLWM